MMVLFGNEGWPHLVAAGHALQEFLHKRKDGIPKLSLAELWGWEDNSWSCFSLKYKGTIKWNAEN